ncbi:MAG TPA: hypothetical protein VNW92_29005 [Polyangiaceae bacterium]|nr:hypothetical protein [Polyangiaceae bacterium]
MNHRIFFLPAALLLAAPALLVAACSSSSSPGTSPGIGGSGGSSGSSSAGGSGNVVTDPGSGSLYLTASGESLAVTGYDFPPATADDTFLVDGWVFRLDHEIVTIGNVTLWDNPDTVPADQSQHGAQVAHLAGPWAIDLHFGGPLTGEGGPPEQALPFAAISAKDDGTAFDTTVRYGFGFDTLAASASATQVNLDADGQADYEFMVSKGYSVLYVGTVSRPAPDGCASAGGSAYDFTTLPTTLKFRLGFSTPTSYVNCQNGSEFPGVQGINGEDYPRGLQFRSDKSVIAQVTVHADHPFWESFAEGSALRFDQIAAQYVGVTDPVATVEDMVGVDFTAFTDKTGKALPMRSCVAASFYTPQYPTGQQLHFDALKVPVDKTGTDPAKAIRDYFEYTRYTQSTQGHLNSQGLCFVARNYPSPAGGS